MGIFNKQPKVDIEKINMQNRILQQQKEISKATFMKQTMNNFETQMNANRSFPAEWYSTGTKQGKYAGIPSYSNRIARDRSRKAVDISPVAESMVNTISTLSVGTGLDLEAAPAWILLEETKSWSPEKKSEWMKKAEARYKAWCKRKSSVYDESMNRYQQEQQEFLDKLIDGEYFHIYRYSSNSKLNPMTIQLIRPEDVRNPQGSMVAQGNHEEDGIEYNSKGQAVAYHIYNHGTSKTVRVPKKGARSGRVFVNHVKLGKNRRGVGIIANMIAELMKLGDYQLLEIQAAVVNALYAVWVETPEGEDGVPTLTGGIGSDAQSSSTEITNGQWVNDRKDLNFTEGGVVVDTLPGGYKINSHNTSRPNVNFGGFMDAVKKDLSASKGIPISVLDKKFENNYSASRGELILAWYEIEKYRFNQSFTDDTIYTMWLWGEILQDKITAPGFGNDEETREAWSGAKWIGNQRPDIDPLKSVKAHILEHNRGYKTAVQITKERDGGDWNDNQPRVKGELDLIADMQKVFAELNLSDQ